MSLLALLSLLAAAALGATSPYTPVYGSCPSGALVRNASGLSSSEAAYLAARKPLAEASLKSWLDGVGAGFTNGSLPTLGLASSGGGYRALLTNGGIRQALDSRDSSLSVAGLYQSLTYESALSGGAWMLGSIAGNGYPTVSELRDTVWEPNFQAGFLLPQNFEFLDAYATILDEVAQKDAAGFPATIIDLYGRLQGYSFLTGTDGGVSKLLSDLASSPNLTAHNVPFPIITSLGVYDNSQDCPQLNSTQFEFTPYEFGSWDNTVHAFTQTKYLGTSLTAGASNGTCVTRYDNLGYVTGTSSNVFAPIVCDVADALGDNFTSLLTTLEKDLTKINNDTGDAPYAIYPNPFYKWPGAAQSYASQKELRLSDGGSGDQNDPIWPMLHRPVDVLFVSDASADTSNNYPNGSEIHNTYTVAHADGLTRMPVIPPASTFVADGYNLRPTFFGCNSNSTMTIIYLPNRNYTTDSGVPTEQLEFSESQTAALIENGNHIANYNGTAGFATCVACAIVKKTASSLPSSCSACYSKYCYN